MPNEHEAYGTAGFEPRHWRPWPDEGSESLISCCSAKQPRGFLYIASPQQGDLRLLGPPSGRGADGGARIRDRRVPADLRADSQATEPPMPPKSHDYSLAIKSN
ncbi:hypothetical protein PoB_002655500 [Plakobranchus ocellatus]|uniref:Uncharacterized protein n=1 Tax=Plakobranchus ocellatus TaxID=259542 RepID=A0AAV3ZXX0_9GAST|nr:hypothetical protein PoB_002655500 [Plakobranchus ocellatus]